MNKLPLTVSFAALILSTTAIAADGNTRGDHAMSNLDVNGDGVVNFVEFQERAFGAFATLDSNQDDELSLDEFINGRPGPIFGGRGGRGRGNDNRTRPEPTEEQMAHMQEMMTERATARFQEMDANGDEVVSLLEFQEASFLNMDQDNNGLLSAEELRPRRHGRPGFGHPESGGQRGGHAPQV
ncbi:MAG: hypothetical protein COA96_14385 [SAR86 cluster bacterium]|uniref:EF-hand domain-containing protein n=1 Tax=SAR86 cluster bacterium TaxID=2030880 RepID=A0A2A5AT88_9GAMM|nr:MAG: hypothetical protein COA96_14385 [SAR86 cluster bacterium]